MAGPEDWGAQPVVEDAGPANWGAIPDEPKPESPSFMTGLMDRVKEGFTQDPSSTRNKMRAGVESQLRTSLSNYPGDVKDVFMEGVHQAKDAFLGNGKSQFDDIRENVENQLIAVGRTPEQAKGETDRLMEGWKRQERMAGAIFGPLTAITAPFFGGPMRSFISRPIEEQTEFPKEATEGFINVGAAALGMRGLARVKIGKDGNVTAHAIGDAPKPEDFKTAADLITTPPRELPIVAFRRQAVEIEAQLPPVADGHVRLWRGNRPGEVGQNPSFTNDLPGIALPFRKSYNGPLSYIDVPAADLAQHELHTAVARGAEFSVPKDVAAKAKQVDFDFRSADGGVPITAARLADTEANLRTLWEERGIHPAEALNDAKNDTWARNELTQPVYHASLHDFEAFDLSKVGTGEGPGGSGYGIYVSDTIEGHQYYLRHLGRDKPALSYRANIPSQEKFLNLDMQLNEQSPVVQKAFAALPADMRSYITKYDDNPTGRTIYARLLESATDQEYSANPLFSHEHEKIASEALFKAGIAGTKAIHGDAGHHSYVIFDDRLIDITHKNGEALTPKERAAAVEEMQPRSGGADVPERVTAAAITLNDGKFFTASTHGEAFNKATEELGISGNELLKLLKSDSQFITSEGRIVSRGEAGKIASENKQFRAKRSGGYTKAEDINFEPLDEARKPQPGGADVPHGGIFKYERATAPDRFGKSISIAVNEVSEIATTSNGAFEARYPKEAAGKFVAKIVGENGESGELIAGGKGFVDKPNKSAFFDTREEALAAAQRAAGVEPARAHDLGAAAPHDPPYVSPAVEPPPPPGSLLADVRGVVDQVVGLGRNLQYIMDPMATGSPRAQVIAKDAISSVRRIRWEHARRDAQIVKEFSPESWERMWNAMDEESVLRQEGKKNSTPEPAPGTTRFYRGEKAGGAPFNPNLAVQPGSWFTTDINMARRYGDLHYVDLTRDQMRGIAQDANHPSEPSFILDQNLANLKKPFKEAAGASEHMGITTLEPRERLMVEILHEESQAAWLHAVDAGMVEGEGLPAYTPRMVLNVAAASDHVAPQALNELGRNVFTRTAQMKHRKNLLAEETEAAAKELVKAKMEKAGKSPAEIAAALEKVQIARNVRAMPLATAKLQEATIWRNMIRNVEDAGKATGSDTVADFNPGKGWFTIAGNPAFTKWAPKLIKDPATGTWRAMGDDLGNTIFEAKPIYMRDEFKGPMMSILDEPPGKVAELASTPYEALMGLKSRSMNLILNSPLIHNAVVWSKVMEAAGGREWLGFGLYRKGNTIVNSNPARASQLIERGLNPMGPRGSVQDITAIMESPNLMNGHNVSFTGKIAAFVPGLFDPAAGAAVERGISTAGNFWHNTLLWDRVRDVHFGLADHLSDRLVAEGADRITADRVSTHFANIIVGSIPKEAMSAAARATANMLLFSRSFTLGNLSTFKQAAFGLPKPIMAQIARDVDVMFRRDPKTGEMSLPSDELTAAVQAEVDASQAFAKSVARRKALMTIALSATLFYAGNAVLQHGFNMAVRDETLDDQLKGYARRYNEMLEDVKKDPLELRHFLERLSPTYDNEPNKQDRIHIGFDKDGTAIYARNPTGKFGEELIGYPTKPMAMLRAKLNPTVSALLDIMENDKGFGHKIYDEHDKTTLGNVETAFAVAKHMVMKHLPEQQITAAGDLLRGDGDPTVNKLRLIGPMFGFTASVGSPKGMAGGEAFAARQELNARFDLNWPMIKRQIQRGDTEGAQQAMEALRIPPMMQRGLLRSAMNPGAPLRGRTLREFYQSATPHQIERFERAPRAPE